MRIHRQVTALLVLLGGLVFGPSGSAQFAEKIALGSIQPPAGIQLQSSLYNAYSGVDVASLGDINGDGYDDLIIGAPQADLGTIGQAGRAYVVFGGPHIRGTSPVDLEFLTGNGFILTGFEGNAYAGETVSGAGDVNGDGYQDIIIGAWGASIGAGGHEGEAYIVYGGPNVGVTGLLDLATLSPSCGAYLRGFQSESDTARAVAGIGDVNQDGIDDVAIGAAKVSAPAPTIAAPNQITWLRAGDLDQNGLADLVVTSEDKDTYTTFFNQGGGDFMKLTFPLLNEPDRFILDDIDLDGDLDMVVTTADWDNVLNKVVGQVVSKRNFGNGLLGFELIEFTGEEYMFHDTGDMDGDGDVDVVVAHWGLAGGARLAVLFNDAPNPPPPPKSFSLSGTPSAVVVGDWDGDNDLDVAVALDSPDTLTFYRNDGSGGLVPGTSLATGFQLTNLRAEDLNGDNRPDVCAYRNAEISVFLNTGGGSFAAGVNYGINDAARDLAVADVDGDGKPDIIAPSLEPVVKHLAVLRNKGAGTFDLPVYSEASGPLRTLDVTDLDGDSLPDVAAGVDKSKDIVLFHGAGTTAFTATETGAAFVLFGGTAALASGSVDLASLDAQNGFMIGGTPNLSHLGRDVAGAGDVNGDGIADLVVGADGYSGLAPSGGAAYVIFGRNGIGATGTFDVTTLDGNNGFALYGVAKQDTIGFAVGPGGDFNGDGHDDILAGGPYAAVGGVDDVGLGAVVFGGPGIGGSGSLTISQLNGANGFRMQGESKSDACARRLGSAGDVNGDGYDDIVIGARGADPVAKSSGRAYLVYGGPGIGASGTIELGQLDGVTGIVLDGAAESDRAGWGVGCAGDLDQDGLDDLVVTAPWADIGSAWSGGISYVLFGQRRTLAADIGSLEYATGGTQTLELAAGTAHAGAKYFVLGSASGFEPGTPLGSILLPLNLDAYLLFTAAHPNTPLLGGTLGTLDAQGRATASFNLPPLAPWSPITLRHAFVLLDQNNVAEFASNQVPLHLN